MYKNSEDVCIISSAWSTIKWFASEKVVFAESSKKRVYKLHTEGEVRQEIVYVGRREVWEEEQTKHRGLQISLSLKIYLKDKMSNNTKITE